MNKILEGGVVVGEAKAGNWEGQWVRTEGGCVATRAVFLVVGGFQGLPTHLEWYAGPGLPPPGLLSSDWFSGGLTGESSFFQILVTSN